MPKAAQVYNYFNFIGGINTETNPLTPIENTCTDMSNVDLLVDGSLTKRKSFEDSAALASAVSHGALSTVPNGKSFYWDNTPVGDLVSVTNDSGSAIFVPRNIPGNHIVAGNTITITGYSGTIVSAVTLAGILIIITSNNLIYAIQIPSGTLLGATINAPRVVVPTIRKSTRVYQGTYFDFRRRCVIPSRIGSPAQAPAGIALTDLFNFGYDLNNSGWSNAILRDTVALIGVNKAASATPARPNFIGPGMPAGTAVGTPLVYYDANGTQLGTGAINGVINAATETYLVTGMTTAIWNALAFVWVQVPGSTGLLPSRFDNPKYLVDTTIYPPKIASGLWNNQVGTTPEVPLGRYIQGLTLTGVTTATTSLRRLWIAKNSSVYFSRVIRTAHSSDGNSNVSIQDLNTFVSDIETMRMKNDPTSSDLFDLLPDDGGDFQINEAGRIIHLEPTGAGVMVFATKGVWVVQGTPGQAFTATDYTIKKVTSIPIIESSYPHDIVETTSVGIAYVSQEGIIVLESQDGYNYSPINITMPTINRLYSSITAEELSLSTLIYDEYEKEIKLLYGKVANNNYFTNGLIYDLRLKAWYRMTMDAGIGLYCAYRSINYDITTDATSLHYIRYDANSGKISEVRQTGTLGNGDLAGAFPYPAFFETKAENWADGFRDKQVDYLSVFCKYTPQAVSNINLRVKWDWAIDPLSNKWVDVGEVYKLDKYHRINPTNGSQLDSTYEVISTKHKVRGTGKALALRFEIGNTSPGHVLGWAILVSGNTTV